MPHTFRENQGEKFVPRAVVYLGGPNETCKRSTSAVFIGELPVSRATELPMA